MPEQISIGANFQNIISGTTDVVNGFGKIEDAVIKTAKAGAEFKVFRDEKTGKIMVKRLENAKGQLVLMNAQGKELVTNFAKVDGRWTHISSTIKESALAAERLAKAAQAGLSPTSSGKGRATDLAGKKQSEIRAAQEAIAAKELAAANKLAARKKQTESDLFAFKVAQNAKALADGIASDKRRVAAFKEGILQSNKERISGQKLLAQSQATAQKAAKRREKAITDQILKSRAVWETLIKLQLSNIATRIFQNIVQDLREAVTLAGQLSKSVAQISTIDISNTALSDINSELVELSNLSGLDVIDVASAQYQALSNQVVNASESFEFLKTANELAVASLATSEQSVNLLSSAINAFQLKASSARDLADAFFKTVELGRLKISDLANSFGRSGVLAKQLGVSVHETLTTLALFTRQGIKVTQASTLMRSIFLKLIKPTEAMKDFLADIGFESGQAAIQSLGFAGVMKLVEAEALRSGNALGELGRMFSRVRAITGAAIFSGTGADEFERDLDAIANSSGAVARAFQTITNSAGQTVDIGVNKLSNALTKGLGSSIIETIANFDRATGAFDTLSAGLLFAGENIGSVSAILTGLLLPSMTKAGVGLSALTIKMVTGEAAAIGYGTSLIGVASAAAPWIAAGALAILVLHDLTSGWDNAASAAEKASAKITTSFEKAQKAASGELLKSLQVQQSRIGVVIKGVFQDSAREIAGSIRGLTLQRSDLTEKLKAIQEGQKDLITQALENFDSRIKKSKDGVSDLESQLSRLTSSIESSEKSVANTILDRALNSQLTNSGKIGVLSGEIGGLEATGPLKGDDEEARLKRIIELIGKRQSLLAHSRSLTDAGLADRLKAEKSLLNFDKARKEANVSDTKAAVELVKTNELNKAKLESAIKIVEARTKEIEAIKNLGKESVKLKKLEDDRLKAQKEVERLGKVVDVNISPTATGGSASAVFTQISSINSEIAKEAKQQTKLLTTIQATGALSSLSTQFQKLVAANSTNKTTVNTASEITDDFINRVILKVRGFSSLEASRKGVAVNVEEEKARVQGEVDTRNSQKEDFKSIRESFVQLREALKANDPEQIKALIAKFSTAESQEAQGSAQTLIAELLKSGKLSEADENQLKLLGANIVKISAILQSQLSQAPTQKALQELTERFLKQAEERSGKTLDIITDPSRSGSQIENDKETNQGRIIENSIKKVTEALDKNLQTSTSTLTRNTNAINQLSTTLGNSASNVTFGDINVTVDGSGGNLDPREFARQVSRALPQIVRGRYS